MYVLAGRPERRSGATFCVLIDDGHFPGVRVGHPAGTSVEPCMRDITILELEGDALARKPLPDRGCAYPLVGDLLPDAFVATGFPPCIHVHLAVR
jgi:hypothetical protein